MNISPGMVVPPAVVLAVTGWSCWSIVSATAPPAAPAAARPKPAEAAAAATAAAADLGEAAERDPFRLPGEPEPTAKAAAAPGKSEAEEKAKAMATAAAGVRKAMTDLSARLAARIKAVRDAEAKRLAARERLARLPLTATSTHGHRRAAIIAGRAYAEGEVLEGTDAAVGPVVLAAVRTREATLHSAVGPVVVQFSESPRSASTAPPPARTAPAAAKRARVGGVVTVRGKAR